MAIGPKSSVYRLFDSLYVTRIRPSGSCFTWNRSSRVRSPGGLVRLHPRPERQIEFQWMGWVVTFVWLTALSSGFAGRLWAFVTVLTYTSHGPRNEPSCGFPSMTDP